MSLDPDIVEQAMALPEDVNLDPADRIIAATAIVKGGRLLTADQNLRKAKAVQTLW